VVFRRIVQSLLILAIVAFGVYDPWVAVWRGQLIVSMVVAVSLIVLYEAVVHVNAHRAHAHRALPVTVRAPSSPRL
jgi:hypothetical protein